MCSVGVLNAKAFVARFHFWSTAGSGMSNPIPVVSDSKCDTVPLVVHAAADSTLHCNHVVLTCAVPA